jgi:hypothetical protein
MIAKVSAHVSVVFGPIPFEPKSQASHATGCAGLNVLQLERLLKQVFVVGVAIGIGVGFLPVPPPTSDFHQVPDQISHRSFLEYTNCCRKRGRCLHL